MSVFKLSVTRRTMWSNVNASPVERAVVIVASKSKGIERLRGCAYDGAGTSSAHAAPCVGDKTRQTLMGYRASICQPNSSSMFFRRKRS
jgi:hypothetical protein